MFREDICASSLIITFPQRSVQIRPERDTNMNIRKTIGKLKVNNYKLLYFRGSDGTTITMQLKADGIYYIVTRNKERTKSSAARCSDISIARLTFATEVTEFLKGVRKL